MKFEITVGGITYSTIKDIREKAQSIMNGAPMNCGLIGDDFAFMHALLKYHPEAEQKFGVGLDKLIVMRPIRYPNTRCLYIERVDGTGTDVSWGACLKPNNNKIDRVRAFREAIDYQIQAFRYDQLKTLRYCPYTNEQLTRYNNHVDHEYPLTFNILVKNFLNDIGITIGEVEITPAEDNQFAPVLIDPVFTDAWRYYHLTHAKLRLISKTANLSHAKKGN